jgi:hypothetical protein
VDLAEAVAGDFNLCLPLQGRSAISRGDVLRLEKKKPKKRRMKISKIFRIQDEKKHN